MSAQVAVEALTRRLAECPEDFLREPRARGLPGGEIDVAAVVADLARDLGLEPCPPQATARWAEAPAEARNVLRLTLIGAWLAHAPELRAAGALGPLVLAWLAGALPPLAALVAPEQFVVDQDRREELARSLLAAIGLLPAGETAAQAADRLQTLSTVERARLLRETRAQQERARQLREQLASERARQAAARYSSE
ncbi:MAG: hypothetical protein QM767_19670 [Anaeromyxobacter sp.]